MKLAEAYFQRLLQDDDPLSAIYTLDSFWCTRLRVGSDGALVGVSEPELDVHLYLIYQGEVGNGGHYQFFTNPSGRYAREALHALERLDFSQAHRILSEACSVFPYGTAPVDADERNTAAERLDVAQLGLWETLDQRLHTFAARNWSAVLHYIKGHQDEILLPERE